MAREGQTMKRAILAIAGVILLASTDPVAAPPKRAEAVARVFVRIVPAISVETLDASVDPPEATTGKWPTEMTFRVEANVQRVNMRVAATDLHRDGRADNPDFISLADQGVSIRAQAATPAGKHTDKLAWAGTDTFNEMRAQLSKDTDLRSDEKDHFGQDVSVSLEYDRATPELPQAQYGGYIKLLTYVTPS